MAENLERTCRACGCTEPNACINHVDGACWWVEPDLCSHCKLTAAALGSKILVAHDLESELVTIDIRHAVQLQKMTSWLLRLPTTTVVDQIKASVDALLLRASR